jgi:hypothetical protein
MFRLAVLIKKLALMVPILSLQNTVRFEWKKVADSEIRIDVGLCKH